MGLRKILQIISLIASNHDAALPTLDRLFSPSTRFSLVVLPLSLLGPWKDQFTEHVQLNSLRIFLHHGSERLTTKDLVAAPDVVLTTYDVVTAEYRKWRSYPIYR